MQCLYWYTEELESCCVWFCLVTCKLLPKMINETVIGSKCSCFPCPSPVKKAAPVHCGNLLLWCSTAVIGITLPWKSGLFHVWAENET